MSFDQVRRLERYLADGKRWNMIVKLNAKLYELGAGTAREIVAFTHGLTDRELEELVK